MKAPVTSVGNMPNRAIDQPPAKPPAIPTQMPNSLTMVAISALP